MLTDMVSENQDELAIAAHQAMEQLQQNGHSLHEQVFATGCSDRIRGGRKFASKLYHFQPMPTAQRRSLETRGTYETQMHRRHAAEADEERVVYNPYIYKYLKHRRRKK